MIYADKVVRDASYNCGPRKKMQEGFCEGHLSMK